MEKSNGFGVASLTSGIIGLVLLFAPYIGIVLSILAVVFANKQRSSCKTGVATAGNILGIIGIAINGVMLIFVLVVLLAYLGTTI